MVEVLHLGQQAAQVFFALIFLFLSQPCCETEGPWSLEVLVEVVPLAQQAAWILFALAFLLQSHPVQEIVNS